MFCFAFEAGSLSRCQLYRINTGGFKQPQLLQSPLEPVRRFIYFVLDLYIKKSSSHIAKPLELRNNLYKYLPQMMS